MLNPKAKNQHQLYEFIIQIKQFKLWKSELKTLSNYLYLHVKLSALVKQLDRLATSEYSSFENHYPASGFTVINFTSDRERNNILEFL